MNKKKKNEYMSDYTDLFYFSLYFTLCYLQIIISTSFYSSLCVICRSVYLHLSILHSVLHVDNYIYNVLLFTLLHVDQCIYSFLFFTLCYMQISVSTPYYSSLCYMQISVYTHYHTPLGITCRSVYLRRSILHCVLHVDHYIYNVLFFTL